MDRLAAILAEAVTVDMQVISFMGQMLALIAMIIVALLTYTKRKADKAAEAAQTAERQVIRESLDALKTLVSGNIAVVQVEHKALKERVNEHIESCNKIDKEVLKQSIDTMDGKIDELVEHNRWVQKSLHTVFSKMRLELEPE